MRTGAMQVAFAISDKKTDNSSTATEQLAINWQKFYSTSQKINKYQAYFFNCLEN